MKQVTHVLLAGDKDYAPFLLEEVNTCFLDFSGTTLLDLTLAAFSSASRVNNLVVVGPRELEEKIPDMVGSKPTRFLLQRESLSENVTNALQFVNEWWPGNSTIFVTNDAPLLSGAELDNFASLVSAGCADIHIAVTRITPVLLRDPLVQQYVRSLVPLSDGLYLLANQVALSLAALELRETVQKLFDLRKQSRYATFVRTLLYVLRDARLRKALSPWLRSVIAKGLWRASPNSELYRTVSLSREQVELGLGRLVAQDLHVRINEIPQAFGCFDADTPQQLRELRKFIGAQAEPLSHMEVANA